MSDPKAPRPKRSGAPGQPIPPIGPTPGRPPIPWTPFGPGDNATPDVQSILKGAEAARARLLKAQLRLTQMRYGPGPDGTPPEVRPVDRADGQWPFLLIRSTPGDTGARPLEPGTIAAIDLGEHDSPDIMFTQPLIIGTPAVGRAEWPSLKAHVVDGLLEFGTTYEIWVHVWNLGQTRATGVRVRTYVDAPTDYRGGAYLDVGDRLSDVAHLIVKAGSFQAGGNGSFFPMIYAVAECLTDPASGDHSPGADRHVGHRRIQVSLFT